MRAQNANLGQNPRAGKPKPVPPDPTSSTGLAPGAGKTRTYHPKTPVRPPTSNPTGSSKPGFPPPLPKFKALDDVDVLLGMEDDEFADYCTQFNALPKEQQSPEAKEALSDSQRRRQERSAGSSSVDSSVIETDKKEKPNHSKKPKDTNPAGNSLDKSRRLPSGGRGRGRNRRN